MNIRFIVTTGSVDQAHRAVPGGSVHLFGSQENADAYAARITADDDSQEWNAVAVIVEVARKDPAEVTNWGLADLCPDGADPEAFGGPWFDQITGRVSDAKAEARLMLQQAAAMERICRCGNELDPKTMGCLERATTGDQIGAFCANCVEVTLAEINFMLGAVPGLAQHHLRITRWNSIVVYSAAGD